METSSSNTVTTTEPESNTSNNENFDPNSNPRNVGTPRKCIPLILDGTFFKIKKSDGDNVSAECVQCKKIIKGRVDAITNFRTHLKTRNHSIKEYDDYQKNKYVHPKKRSLNYNSDTSKKMKQLTLNKHIQSHDQEQADHLITNFVVQTMNPLVIVEHVAFRSLLVGINKLSSPINVMTRKTLSNRIDSMFSKLITSIKDKLKNVQYICTTVDVWSSSRRSYMGVTAHWINESFERKGVAVACRRFKGSHTYDKITELIVEIHNEFIETSKSTIVKTVTDNGANMVKAFSQNCKSQEYPTLQTTNRNLVLREFLNDQTFRNTLEIEIEDADIDGDDEDETMISIAEIINAADTSEDDLYFLPDHQRCVCHTLSLITNDIQAAHTEYPNSVYAKMHNSVFGKCFSLSNLTARSPKAAEIYQNISNCSPTSPCPTRWNSKFDFLQNLMKQKDKLNQICQALNLPVFRDIEFEFLGEYVEILRPIAEAIDKLQGSNNTFYGELLPHLMRIKKILTSFQLRHLKFCSTLVSALLDSLQKRFGDYLSLSSKVNDAILASITHPFFKLRWVPKNNRNQLKELLLNEIECWSKSSNSLNANEDTVKNCVLNRTHCEDYFMFDESSGSDCDAHISNRRTSNLQLQALQYLENDSVDLPMLKQYPIIQQMFVKYNTPLPSSAPVERLFSYAGMIMRPKRRCMTDIHMEKLLILKANNNFVNTN